MKAIFLEGTWEEISAAGAAFIDRGAVAVGPGAAASPPRADAASSYQPVADEASDASGPVSVRLAREILRRRTLSPAQRRMLKMLYDAGSSRVTGTELQEALKLSRPEFSGMMGAFGRRITHTEGWVNGDWFFDQEWDHEAYTYAYTLPDTVRKAMEAEKLV